VELVRVEVAAPAGDRSIASAQRVCVHSLRHTQTKNIG
jgi:hypothetical protein